MWINFLDFQKALKILRCFGIPEP